MNKYKSKDFKSGLKVIINNDLFVILQNEFSKPGKGKAFNRLKLRNIRNNKIIKKTVKIGEEIQSADFYDKEVKFLYSDKRFFYFIDINIFEHYEVDRIIIGDRKYWLKENMTYTLSIWNGEPLDIKVSKTIILKVVSIENVFQNTVVAKNIKFFVLETGICIKLPVFIKINDYVKIDTEKKEYISRVN